MSISCPCRGAAHPELRILLEQRADHLEHHDHHRREGRARELTSEPRLEAGEIELLGLDGRCAHRRVRGAGVGDALRAVPDAIPPSGFAFPRGCRAGRSMIGAAPAPREAGADGCHRAPVRGRRRRRGRRVLRSATSAPDEELG